MTRLIPAVVPTSPGVGVPLLACIVWWAATPLWLFQKYELQTPCSYYPCTYLFCLIRFSIVLWNCCARSKATSSMSSGMLARRAHSIPNDSRPSPVRSSEHTGCTRTCGDPLLHFVQKCDFTSSTESDVWSVSHVYIFYFFRIFPFNISSNDWIVSDEECFALCLIHKFLKHTVGNCHLKRSWDELCVPDKRLTPSNVEVPRPSSSRMTRLLEVAVRRMSLVSDISTIKVERPLARSSEAVNRSTTLKSYHTWNLPPILVRIESCRPILTDPAGT